MIAPFVSADLFWSAEVKLARAEKHLGDLDSEITAFIGRNPYQIVCDEDTEPAIKIYRIKIAEKIPAHWSAVIGDTIHNVRGSLDNMATSLIKRAGHTSRTALDEAKFPIRADAASLSHDTTFFRLIGADAAKVIHAIEPYKGGKGHELWALHHLDIIDKHRAIIPVGATFGSITIKSSKPPASMPNEHFPLKDGDEVFRSVFFEDHFHTNPQLSYYIALHELPYADRQPVTIALRGYIDFAQSVLEALRALVV